jgi:hypothetical protein
MDGLDRTAFGLWRPLGRGAEWTTTTAGPEPEGCEKTTAVGSNAAGKRVVVSTPKP